MIDLLESIKLPDIICSDFVSPHNVPVVAIHHVKASSFERIDHYVVDITRLSNLEPQSHVSNQLRYFHFHHVLFVSVLARVRRVLKEKNVRPDLVVRLLEHCKL
jgi:hypothetical protein